MAQTPSTMLALGTKAPSFRLLEPLTGKLVALDDFADARALLVVFTCNHCPFVKHLRGPLLDFAKAFAAKGLATVGVCSNDAATYPDDAPDAMAAEARRFEYPFPYLHDATQEVAKAFRAACTPDFFLFDAQRALVYRGQFDGSRPGNGVPVTGADLRAAAEAVLEGRAVSSDQRPSIGCNIKWRPGNAPA